MVKRKRFLAMGILALVLLIGGAVVLIQYDLRTYVRMGGVAYDRYSQTLDLSGKQDVEFEKLSRFYHLRQLNLRETGMTVAQYERLRAQLPECQIQWQVPFQGELLELDTQSVAVNTLSMEDVHILTFLPELRQVDGTGCTDYAALDALARAIPDCGVDYRVMLDGRFWERDAQYLELKGPDLEELGQALPYLPNVREILLTDSIPDPGLLQKMEETYPAVSLYCALGARVLPVGSGHRELDLRGETLNLEGVRQLLDLLPDLERVDLRDTTLTSRELMGLCDARPELFILWDVPFGDGLVPSDAEEVDISGQNLENTESIEEMLPYLPKLKKVVMCDCGIGNEEMDALNRRYADLRFVWRVYIGPYGVRTDDLFFAPVKYNGHVTESQMGPLKYCTDLVAIDLGHMDINTCAWAADIPNLQYLILADTAVSDISPLANHEKLVFLELFPTPCRDYSPLLTCPNMEDLNLCYSYGSAEPVRKMTWLKRLWWDGNLAQTRGLAEYLPDTECNFQSGSSTGGTWRQGRRYKEQRDILGMPYLVG